MARYSPIVVQCGRTITPIEPLSTGRQETQTGYECYTYCDSVVYYANQIEVFIN
jgi:hypothetical protein